MLLALVVFLIFKQPHRCTFNSITHFVADGNTERGLDQLKSRGYGNYCEQGGYG